MRKILLGSLLTLAACATGPGLQSRMAGYIGAPEATLIQNLGVPDKNIIVAGTQYLAYVRDRSFVTPGVMAFGGYGGFAGQPFGPFYGGPFIDAGLPPQLVTRRCETTFTLQNDKVVNVTLRGDDCS